MVFHFKLLAFVSIVIWLFPPIRQYKTQFFWLFLVFAITDPVSLVIGRALELIPFQTYIFFLPLLIISLINFKTYKVLSLIFLSFIGIWSYLTFINFWSYWPNYSITINFILLLLIIKKSFESVLKNESVNIFHVILIFYQTLNLLKYFYFLKYFSVGLWFFYTSSLIQIFVGIFFSLYREDDKRLFVKLPGYK